MPSSIEASSNSISEAFSGWLQDEIRSSSDPTNRNRYLNDFETAIRGLKGGWDHPDNYSAIKLRSHLDRLPFWFESFTQDPANDFLSARIVFAALMQVSGSYRNQCYLQAQDAEDYIKKRLSKPIGTNLDHLIERRISQLLPVSREFAEAGITIDSLDVQREAVSRIGESAVKRMCSRTKIGYDFGQQDSTSVREMIVAQSNWATFAIDAVTLAAKIRGGKLVAVPFLEAKSISDDPQVIYPLAA